MIPPVDEPDNPQPEPEPEPDIIKIGSVETPAQNSVVVGKRVSDVVSTDYSVTLQDSTITIAGTSYKFDTSNSGLILPDGSIDADGLVDMVIGDDDETYYPKQAAKNTHYLPVILNAPDKSVITYIDLGGNLQRVEAINGKINLLLTATSRKNFTITLYADMADAKKYKDGQTYTVDISKCNFTD